MQDFASNRHTRRVAVQNEHGEGKLDGSALIDRMQEVYFSVQGGWSDLIEQGRDLFGSLNMLGGQGSDTAQFMVRRAAYSEPELDFQTYITISQDSESMKMASLTLLALLGLFAPSLAGGTKMTAPLLSLTVKSSDDRLPPSPIPDGWLVDDIRPVKLQVTAAQNGFVTFVLNSASGRRLLPPSRTPLRATAGQAVTLTTQPENLAYGPNEIQVYFSHLPLTLARTHALAPDTTMTLYKEKMPLSPPKVDRLPLPPRP